MKAGQGDVTVTVRGIEASVGVDQFARIWNYVQGYTERGCIVKRRKVVADLRTVSRFSAAGLVELKCLDVRLADLRQARRQSKRRV